MPQIEPRDKSLKNLKGLHLWHAPLSSCSQRVRLVLAERGLAFQSHVVNLEAGEHASAAYQAIHPKGVVPALVQDGRLFIESIDIIRHLASDDRDLSKGAHDLVHLADGALDLLYLADGAQADLKLLTFEFLFQGMPPPTEDQAKAFQNAHRNAWLKQFHLDFQAGFDRDRIDHAVRRTAAAFSVVDARLADGRRCLSGDALSLDDIAWLPNAHRFSLMGWPMEQTPFLAAWFERMRARQSYPTALTDWQPDEVTEAFARYTAQRRAQGTDIRMFGGLGA